MPTSMQPLGQGSNRYRKPHPCPTCGTGPLSGRLYCVDCGKARAEIYRAAYDERHASGPNMIGCVRCGKLSTILTNPLRTACCRMALEIPRE